MAVRTAEKLLKVLYFIVANMITKLSGVQYK